MATYTQLGSVNDKSGGTTVTVPTNLVIPATSTLVVMLASEEVAANVTIVTSTGNLVPTVQQTSNINNTGESVASLFIMDISAKAGATLTSVILGNVVANAAAAMVYHIDALVGSVTNSNGIDTGTLAVTGKFLPIDIQSYKIVVGAIASEDTISGFSAVAVNPSILSVDAIEGTSGAGAASNMTLTSVSVQPNGSTVTMPSGSTGVTIESGTWAYAMRTISILIPVTVQATVLNIVMDPIPIVSVTGKARFPATALKVVADIVHPSVFPIPTTVLDIVATIEPHYNLRTTPIYLDVTEFGALGGHALDTVAINSDPEILIQSLVVLEHTQEYTLQSIDTLTLKTTQEWEIVSSSTRTLEQDYLLDVVTTVRHDLYSSQEWAHYAPSASETWLVNEEYQIDAPDPFVELFVPQDYGIVGVSEYTTNTMQSYVIDGPLLAQATTDQRYRLEPTYTKYGASTQLYGIRVATTHVDKYTATVSASSIALYSVRIAAQHVSGIGYKVAATHSALYRSPARVTPVASHTSEYGKAVRVVADNINMYSKTIKVAGQDINPYKLNILNPIHSSHIEAYDLIGAITAAIHTNTVPVVTYQYGNTSHTAEILAVSVFQDEGSYLWQAEMTLVDTNDFARLQRGSVITLNMVGEDYVLVVDYKGSDRTSQVAQALRITAVSPIIALDSPTATRVTKTWDTPTPAKSIVEEIISPAGLSISWELIDWVIPENRLSVERATPLAIIQNIISAVGGVLESNPDGSLVARHKYPIPTNDYNGKEDQVYTEPDHILESSSNTESNEYYNSIEVGDVSPSSSVSDSLEYIASDTKAYEGTIKLYPQPWRTNVRLVSTGEAQILTSGIVKTEVHTETVEVVESSGNTAYPIHIVNNVTWHTLSLGGVVPDLGTTTFTATSEDARFSLVDITYTTKYIEYTIQSVTGSTTQFIVEED
ncbi:MAG: hypothetical protein GQ570_03970 [Helicobacteraceae bacterium]|nr:hypothetical protein [Helicobacteraceae bacterium]